MNEVLPQLNELLFSPLEGVLVESVEVIDTGRPDRGPYDRGTGGLSGVRVLVGANSRLPPASSS
ncbi:hypothetical protein OIU91_00190 [Streptomyces sp. NBC_01456]|uniref:hypothetical protein n=1 Tax=unclassified Streptomyces TaxID=2593676 RepID=UPI002E380410|nr:MULTISPECIES: hypothetical protein [unclassified Streptomyces]